MTRRKYFTVEEAYVLLPTIRQTLLKCKDQDITIKKVIVQYNKTMTHIIAFNFLIGQKGEILTRWTYAELKSWLSRQKNYTTPPSQELKKFVIPVTRIGYAYRDMEVMAISQEDAEDKALNEAGNFEFTERESEYKVVY